MSKIAESGRHGKRDLQSAGAGSRHLRGQRRRHVEQPRSRRDPHAAAPARRPAGVHPAATNGPAATGRPGVRIVRVSDPDELATAERVIVDGFPLRAFQPLTTGTALPRRLLDTPGFDVWLGYRDGRPAVAGYTYDDGHSIGVYWLATLPEHRSTGMGRAMLATAVATRPHRPWTLVATENTRALVRAAMRSRCFFATRVSGLRLDATANGVRMGGTTTAGDVRFRVDLDRGPDWIGKPLRIQVLRPGSRAPSVPLVVDTEAGRVAEFTVPLSVTDGPWVVLRVSDPTRANASPGPTGHPCNDWGVAYTSPWWLT